MESFPQFKGKAEKLENSVNESSLSNFLFNFPRLKFFSFLLSGVIS